MNNTSFLKQIDNSWTLFLDRDGVINRRLVQRYVQNWGQFKFLPGVLDAIAKFSKIFYKIIIVTNQRGIGRGLMSIAELEAIHENMLSEIEKSGGRIDSIIYCSKLYEETPNCRKPDPFMALRAQEQFPAIDFEKSIMIGDMESDIIFGSKLGMKTVWINENKDSAWENAEFSPDLKIENLLEFANYP